MTRVHPRSVVGRRADLEESADSVPSVDRVPRFILTLIREDQIGGAHLGAFVGSCLTPQAGHLQATFYSDSTSNTTDDGASLESIEYREYQAGATPLALPLRFPGQYDDPETDLHENWHRFYDPSTERYLEPEPMWAQPDFLHATLGAGFTPLPDVGTVIGTTDRIRLRSEIIERLHLGHVTPVHSCGSDDPLVLVDPAAEEPGKGGGGGGGWAPVGEFPGPTGPETCMRPEAGGVSPVPGALLSCSYAGLGGKRVSVNIHEKSCPPTNEP